MRTSNSTTPPGVLSSRSFPSTPVDSVEPHTTDSFVRASDAPFQMQMTPPLFTDPLYIRFCDRVVSYIKTLNASKTILYPFDLLKSLDSKTHTALFTLLAHERFEATSSPLGFMYHPVEGGNFAQDLRHLVEKGCIPMDCGLAVVVAYLLALVDFQGESSVNSHVEHMFGKNKPFQISYHWLDLFCCIHRKETLARVMGARGEPVSYQKGQHILVDMGDTCRAWHPGSDSNSYHLLCSTSGDAEHAKFIGFSSNPMEPMTLPAMKALLTEKANRPLTYLDLYKISQRPGFEIHKFSTTAQTAFLHALANAENLVFLMTESTLRCSEEIPIEACVVEYYDFLNPRWHCL
jgi:hypothetical protein